MWFLKNDNGKLIYLKPNETIIVGRKKGYIILPGDGSISRVHAEITVTPVPDLNKITDISQPLSECVIKDSGSKYGNFIMKDGVATAITQEGCKLRHMDRIRFGLQNYVFTIHYIPILTATSGMAATEKEELEKLIDAIDGKITNAWTPLCTHMTIETPIISEKLSCALVNQIPIVTMDYWSAVEEAVEENKEIPDPVDFAHFIDSKMRQLGDISVRPNIARRKLFENLTFVHFKAKQYALYSRMIKLAGGKSVQYGKVRPNPNVCNDNIIVVQHVETDTTQATRIGDGNYAAVCEELRKCKRRSIPESEIAIAILHCSIEKYCNPKYDYAEIFTTLRTQNKQNDATILALDTQDVKNPFITNRGRKNDSKKSSALRTNAIERESMHLIPETVDSCDVDSQIAKKSHENPSNDSTNRSKNFPSKLTKTFENSNYSSWNNFTSESEIGSMKVASLNHENYIYEELSDKTSINKVSTKRGREIEDEIVDERKKKICIESSSIDNCRSEEGDKSSKADKYHGDMLSDDEDIFFEAGNAIVAETVPTFVAKKEERRNSAREKSVEGDSEGIFASKEFEAAVSMEGWSDDDVVEYKSVSSSAKVREDGGNRNRTREEEKRNSEKEERNNSKEERNNSKEERNNSKEERNNSKGERNNSKEERNNWKGERNISKEERNNSKGERNTSKDSFENDDENPRKRKIGRSYFSPFADATENELKRKKPDNVNEKQSNKVMQASSSQKENISVDLPSPRPRKRNENVIKKEEDWINSTTNHHKSERKTGFGSGKSETSPARDYETSQLVKIDNDSDSTMVPLLRMESLADITSKNGPSIGKRFRKQKITIPVRVELDDESLDEEEATTSRKTSEKNYPRSKKIFA